jgi:hypothetical protein
MRANAASVKVLECRERLLAKTGDVSGFYRLYMVPF